MHSRRNDAAVSELLFKTAVLQLAVQLEVSLKVH